MSNHERDIELQTKIDAAIKELSRLNSLPKSHREFSHESKEDQIACQQSLIDTYNFQLEDSLENQLDPVEY